MQDRFEQIYATDEWGSGSGEGSDPRHAQGYARFLERFIRDRGFRSVLDLGCGDWQFSRMIDWRGVHYLGLDIVSAVIERNQASFGGGSIEFRRFDGSSQSLPTADLIVIKDVLQHWSNAAILAFLPRLEAFGSALITNCVDPSGSTGNADIPDGGFRYLDLLAPPFNLAGRVVYEFTNRRSLSNRLFGQPRWRKHVILVENFP